LQVIKYRASRPGISIATNCKVPQRLNQRLHLSDPRVQDFDMSECYFFDHFAALVIVVP
jgi:hypothetical protein